MTDLNISVLRFVKPKISKPIRITTIMSLKFREDMLREKIPLKKRDIRRIVVKETSALPWESYNMTFV